MIKYLLLILIIIIIVVTGCSSQEEQVIDRLKTDNEENYNVIIFTEDTPSPDYQDQVRNIDILSGGGKDRKIKSFSYIILNEEGKRKVDYESVFEIENYPEIVVLDNKGVVLQTNKLEELQTFLEK